MADDFLTVAALNVDAPLDGPIGALLSNLAGSLCQGGVFLFFDFLRQSFFTFFNAALNADHSKEASLLIAGEDDAVEEGNVNTGLGKEIGGTCTLACVNRVGLSVRNDADRTARC